MLTVRRTFELGEHPQPVTLAECKAYLRVTHTADDALIDSFIDIARLELENQTGVALIQSEVYVEETEYKDYFRLPFAPMNHVFVATLDGRDIREEFLNDALEYRIIRDHLALKSSGHLLIHYRTAPAGNAKLPMLDLVAALYTNRGSDYVQPKRITEWIQTHTRRL